MPMPANRMNLTMLIELYRRVSFNVVDALLSSMWALSHEHYSIQLRAIPI